MKLGNLETCIIIGKTIIEFKVHLLYQCVSHFKISLQPQNEAVQAITAGETTGSENVGSGSETATTETTGYQQQYEKRLTSERGAQNTTSMMEQSSGTSRDGENHITEGRLDSQNDHSRHSIALADSTTSIGYSSDSEEEGYSTPDTTPHEESVSLVTRFTRLVSQIYRK